MNSEKVKDIKKVLEMFAIDDKEMTLFQSPVPQGESCMKIIKYADILTLINELESENEWLVGKIKEKVNEMTTYTVNNQKLKDRIAELEKENKELAKQVVKITGCSVPNEEVAYECNKKLKQFAERLKEKIVSMKWAREDVNEKLIKQGATIKAIDETLKEFINKGDDKR